MGTVSVAPPDNIRKYLEGSSSEEDTAGDKLKDLLEEMMSLPKLSPNQKVTDTDLVLNIVISRFYFGSGLEEFSLPDISIPVFWRPKIEVGARLTRATDGKTVYTSVVVTRMPWKEYLSRTLSFKGIIGWGELFNIDDINMLLGKSCIRLLEKLRNEIS